MKFPFVLLVLCLPVSAWTSFAAPKPNIVFILADDQGYGDLSCFGSTTISTPNIDSLCEQGMKFESFYVHNRYSPTRAAFMTGCHAQRVDMGKVIYASDNGPQLNAEGYGSAGPLRDGKGFAFAGGIRVPCLMRWPGNIPAGTTHSEITGIIDMLPTFCELAGVDAPADRIIDGKNILPYLLGKKPDTPIHETFIVPGETIRYGDWKLLVKDQHPEKAAELKKMMDAFMGSFKEEIRPRQNAVVH